MANLYWRPETEAAKALVKHFTDKMIEEDFRAGERKRWPRATARKSLEASLGGWVAELLRHSRNEEAWGYLYCLCPTKKADPSLMQERALRDVKRLWPRLGWMEDWKDCFEREQFEGKVIKCRRWAKRFRGTTRLLDLGETFGITPENLGDHFLWDAGKINPLRLRARSTGYGKTKERGKILKITPM